MVHVHGSFVEELPPEGVTIGPGLLPERHKKDITFGVRDGLNDLVSDSWQALPEFAPPDLRRLSGRLLFVERHIVREQRGGRLAEPTMR